MRWRKTAITSLFHYNRDTWASWRLESPTIRLFLQQFVQADKENAKGPHDSSFKRGIHPSQRVSHENVVSMPWRHHEKPAKMSAQCDIPVSLSGGRRKTWSLLTSFSASIINGGTHSPLGFNWYAQYTLNNSSRHSATGHLQQAKYQDGY